jgi:hypothetical protein
MWLAGAVLSQTSSPVFFLTAMKLGDAVDVTLVHSVAGHGEDEIPDDQRAARSQVVWKDVEFTDHVQLPDDVFVDLALARLVLERSVVLAVAESVDVGADQLGPVGDVVQAVSLEGRSGADTLQRPVVHAAGAELGVGRLPQELARLGVEGHDVAPVALELRVDLEFVVRADEDLSVVHDGAGVGLRAERHRPLDVQPGFGVELRGDALLVGCHVAFGRVAEHGDVRRLRRCKQRDAGDRDHRREDQDRVLLVAHHQFTVTLMLS